MDSLGFIETPELCFLPGLVPDGFQHRSVSADSAGETSPMSPWRRSLVCLAPTKESAPTLARRLGQKQDAGQDFQQDQDGSVCLNLPQTVRDVAGIERLREKRKVHTSL